MTLLEDYIDHSKLAPADLSGFEGEMHIGKDGGGASASVVSPPQKGQKEQKIADESAGKPKKSKMSAAEHQAADDLQIKEMVSESITYLFSTFFG